MLKLFLVEDEFVVREGIKNIDWLSEGFIFCGEATDGELAYPIIQREQPDIIITDIKMPFLDGLELSRLIKKELPQSKIIILSGHEEFRYAQEAVKIGITEYLLKPINSTELIKSIKNVGQKIIVEREEKRNLERYKSEMQENEIETKRKLFNEMISGTLSIAQILECGKKLELELSAQHYQIVLYKYYVDDNNEDDSCDLFKISEELSSIDSRSDSIVLFHRAIEGSALLIKGHSIEQIDSMREEYLAAVKAVFDRYPTVRYFGGIGKPVGRLTHLSDSFESAAHAFSLRFILDKSIFINFREISAHLTDKDDGSALDALELSGADRKKVDAFLRSGEVDEITFFVEEFLKSTGSASEKSFLFRQYILMDIYLTALIFLKEIGGTEDWAKEPFIKPDKFNEVLSDSKKVKDYIMQIFTVAIGRRNELSTKRYHRMIDQAKGYINKHYADDDISLKEVAAHVSISPTHFSAVFSRETGRSFIKFLTDLRINKAKELLKCSDMRCSEISMAVGYKDPHYFSYLFKKVHNCSPIQYRASKG